VVEFENKRDRKKGWYAFQIDDDQIVFVRTTFCQSSRRFPNSDFSLVDIADEKGNIVAGFARSHGDPLRPIRSLSEQEAAGLRAPAHMEIVSGDLTQIDTFLSAERLRS
jgi:hypothetical protein